MVRCPGQSQRELLVGLVAATLGVVAWLMLAALVQQPEHLPDYSPGPRFWPGVLLLSMAGVGGLMTIHGLLGRRSRQRQQGQWGPISDDADADAAEAVAGVPSIPHCCRADSWRALAVCAVLVFYLLVVDRLGILPASTGLLVTLALLSGYRRVISLALLGLLLPWLLYLLFTRLAGLPLPEPLFFL